MACIRWRSDVFGCGRVCLIQWCLLLTDSVGSQTARLSAWLSAHCHLMEIAEDCGSQIHNYCYILLFFLASGIFTFYRGISSWLIGNCNRHQLFWEQRYKAPSSLNTFQSVSQSVTSYCAAQKKDGQWKAGLRRDYIWLIYNDPNL